MAYERPHDLRVEKTIDAIQTTFKQMLLETDFSHVTVKELCERARINKKTFYRYYPALEYLLAEMQQSYAKPYIEKVQGLKFPENTEEITRIFLTYSAKQDKLYERITCAGSYDAIRSEMIQHVRKHHQKGSDAPKHWDQGIWEIYLSFVTSAPLHIYRQWIADGKSISPEEMVNVGCSLVCKGARSIENAMK